MVANKLMRGVTVLPVAHHRGEADVVEEVCDPHTPSPTHATDTHTKKMCFLMFVVSLFFVMVCLFFCLFLWEDRSYSPKVGDQQRRSPQATFTPQATTGAGSWTRW